MTYIEHNRDCNIFKDTFARNNGCDCSARFARAPMIMGPHEELCPYLSQMPVLTQTGKVPERLPMHGICYCSASPSHDSTCTGLVCWNRRTGVVRMDLGNGVLIMPAGLLGSGSKTVDKVG